MSEYQEHEILGYKVVFNGTRKMAVFKPLTDRFGNRFFEMIYEEDGFTSNEKSDGRLVKMPYYPSFSPMDFLKELIQEHIKLKFDKKMDEVLK